MPVNRGLPPSWVAARIGALAGRYSNKVVILGPVPRRSTGSWNAHPRGVGEIAAGWSCGCGNAHDPVRTPLVWYSLGESNPCLRRERAPS